MVRDIWRGVRALFLLVLLAGFVGVYFQNRGSASSTTVRQDYVTIGKHANLGETLKLLNAENVPSDRQVVVSGEMIHHYLADGSNQNTQVFSSAKVSPRTSGVAVQIATPQNITLVSPETYANAAITVGMRDVLITVASATSVTGEGALAGIYALQEKFGKLNTDNVAIAQDELTLITNVAGTSDEANTRMNAASSEIKQEIAIKKQNGESLSVGDITQIVNNVTNNYNIQLNGDNNQLAVDVYSRFANSDVAMDKNVTKQLNQLSSTLAQEGEKFLKGLNTKLADPNFRADAENFLVQAWNQFVALLTFIIQLVIDLVSGIFNSIRNS